MQIRTKYGKAVFDEKQSDKKTNSTNTQRAAMCPEIGEMLVGAKSTPSHRRFSIFVSMAMVFGWLHFWLKRFRWDNYVRFVDDIAVSSCYCFVVLSGMHFGVPFHIPAQFILCSSHEFKFDPN